jgi:hypothetical protein
MTDDSDNIVPLPKPKKGGSKRNPGVGKPVYGGPAMGAGGPGWGGPAKGKGKPPGSDGDALRKWHALDAETRRQHLLDRESQAQEALDVMVNIMREAEHDAIRLAAAEKVRNQIMGTPIQRTIVDKQPIKRDVIDPSDLTFEERDALRSTLEKAAQKRAANGDED